MSVCACVCGCRHLFYQEVYSSLDNMHTVDNIAPCAARCWQYRPLRGEVLCYDAADPSSVLWRLCDGSLLCLLDFLSPAHSPAKWSLNTAGRWSVWSWDPTGSSIKCVINNWVFVANCHHPLDLQTKIPKAKISLSRRRPLIKTSPGWKRLLAH